jgi:hypothetical protein
MTETDNSTGLRLLLIVLGFWVVMRAVNKDSSGRTLVNYLTGSSGSSTGLLPTGAAGTAAATVPATGRQVAAGAAAAGSGAAALGQGAAAGVAGLLAGVTGTSTNPVPGATASRLDQGLDVTSKAFESPFAGTVVASEQHDSGWQGGGYVAIQEQGNPQEVVYEAEGLAPVVRQGQPVNAGQVVATPVASPYNNIVGNAEIGLANPASPTQPLAQVVSNPAAEVLGFYQWIRSLGGPVATSTGNAGKA